MYMLIVVFVIVIIVFLAALITACSRIAGIITATATTAATAPYVESKQSIICCFVAEPSVAASERHFWNLS
jgi:hypothetical protein